MSWVVHKENTHLAQDSSGWKIQPVKPEHVTRNPWMHYNMEGE